MRWVLLAGLREEEITAMTQSTLLASFSKGTALQLCLAVVFLMGRQAALEKEQQICRLVEDEQLPNGPDLYVTVSIGISYVNLTLGASLYECIKIADMALYEAKKAGKNRAHLLDVEAVKEARAQVATCGGIEEL